YIIEGPEFPDPNALYGNIPSRYIESSIFHLAIRDGVGILRSKDSLDNAKMLARFMCSMDTLCKRKDMNLAEDHADFLDLSIEPSENIAMLTHAHKKTDHEIARELWSCFPGISVESADEYIKYWSISDIVCGKITAAEISDFKLSSGRRVSKKVVSGLTNIPDLVEIVL